MPSLTFTTGEWNLRAAIGAEMREEDNKLVQPGLIWTKQIDNVKVTKHLLCKISHVLFDVVVVVFNDVALLYCPASIFSWRRTYPQQRCLHCAHHQWVESQFQLPFNGLRVSHGVLRLSQQHITNLSRHGDKMQHLIKGRCDKSKKDEQFHLKAPLPTFLSPPCAAPPFFISTCRLS